MSSFYVQRWKRWADKVRNQEAKAGYAWDRVVKLDSVLEQEMLQESNFRNVRCKETFSQGLLPSRGSKE